VSALFVTGAGTDVGKTFVACGLATELRRRGRVVAAFKPLASGFDPAQPEASDPGALLTALGEPATVANLDRIAPWRYRAALAPDMAAEAEGKRIDFDALVAFSLHAATSAEFVIIEGVGGVMSPISASSTVLDWMAELALPALLVSGSHLGAQSHALTALLALHARRIAVLALVVSETEGSTVGLVETRNSLARFAAPTPVVSIPRLARDASHAAFRTIADLFCGDATHVR